MRHANCDNETHECIAFINFATLIIVMNYLYNNKRNNYQNSLTMKKITLFLLFASLFVYCSADNVVAKVHNPFDSSSKLDRVQRNKIVVISDLHLGNDLTYSENVETS